MRSLANRRPKQVRVFKPKQPSPPHAGNAAPDANVAPGAKTDVAAQTPGSSHAPVSEAGAPIELLAGSMRSISAHAETVVVCVKGTFWLTEDHSNEDIVLGCGERYRITQPGRTIVVALTAGAYCVLRESPSGPTPKQRGPARVSLRKFLRSSRLRSRLPALL